MIEHHRPPRCVGEASAGIVEFPDFEDGDDVVATAPASPGDRRIIHPWFGKRRDRALPDFCGFAVTGLEIGNDIFELVGIEQRVEPGR